MSFFNHGVAKRKPLRSILLQSQSIITTFLSTRVSEMSSCGVLTLVVVAVDAHALGDGAVQRAGLVVVLGAEALLQPVVQMDAPGGAALSELVKAAERTQSHARSKRLALFIETNLPVVLP